jgi:hypothetical protein
MQFYSSSSHPRKTLPMVGCVAKKEPLTFERLMQPVLASAGSSHNLKRKSTEELYALVNRPISLGNQALRVFTTPPASPYLLIAAKSDRSGDSDASVPATPSSSPLSRVSCTPGMEVQCSQESRVLTDGVLSGFFDQYALSYKKAESVDAFINGTLMTVVVDFLKFAEDSCERHHKQKAKIIRLFESVFKELQERISLAWEHEKALRRFESSVENGAPVNSGGILEESGTKQFKKFCKKYNDEYSVNRRICDELLSLLDGRIGYLRSITVASLERFQKVLKHHVDEFRQCVIELDRIYSEVADKYPSYSQLFYKHKFLPTPGLEFLRPVIALALISPSRTQRVFGSGAAPLF